MEFDVVIVGGGPAGLSTSCRLMQLAQEGGTELSVVVLEKGSEVGAHILSGAILEPTAINELFPDWKNMGAPLHTAVTTDEMHFYTSMEKSIKVPNALIPKPMHNDGNYIVSLGNVTRWLGEQAEALGVEIFPGFAASEVLYHPDGSVAGVATGDMGIGADGEHKASFEPGIELRAKYTVFAEGCRGHLGKQLISRFNLDGGKSPQHYGIGLKELWKIDKDKHQPGLVVHGAGWPLGESGATGGSFLYHLEDQQVVVGLIVDLNYDNTHLSPFDEFQVFKHHASIKSVLENGERIAYGARAIVKGGLNSLPKMNFPGGLLIGCDAGTLNFSKIKGSHTAMKSGMIAAETLFAELSINPESAGKNLDSFGTNFQNSWLYKELHASRNFGPAMHKFGTYLGGAFNYIDQNLLGGKMPFTLKDDVPDHSTLKSAEDSKMIHYPKPDGKISFDKPGSVFLSNTNHEEDQPSHLTLADPSIPISKNLPEWAEPAQRYCPAGVYEVTEKDGEPIFQINSQNCVHCKTCDIKDPSQNITWVSPEGGGGPNYPNM
ncbi:electron transfer flavoprotein-ubiquinone oxidoreductase [Chromatiales bacterium (ex Bugula neritina AB1)]|nr:electron transfer flavoprotein-ubiquinone oxidoreductase [Chromatiales bacterium (ex Bugula neritina AB1)]